MLAVLTSLFNMSNDPARLLNYNRFKEQMSGLPFYSVEVNCNETEDFKTDSILKITAKHDQNLWQKERILNLLCKQLPPEVSSVAWIDSDVLFLNPDWHQQAEKVLKKKPVVQLFSHAHFLSESGSRERSFRSSGSVGGYWSSNPRSHCGYAWAMRRNTWEQLGGLFDLDVVGGGDAWMAHAFFGEQNTEFTNYSSGPMRDEFKTYWDKCQKLINENVGCVPGDILHLYHGELNDRNYWGRHCLMKTHRFNPELDLKPGANGLHRWTGHNLGLQRAIAQQIFIGSS